MMMQQSRLLHIHVTEVVWTQVWGLMRQSMESWVPYVSCTLTHCNHTGRAVATTRWTPRSTAWWWLMVWAASQGGVHTPSQNHPAGVLKANASGAVWYWIWGCWDLRTLCGASSWPSGQKLNHGWLAEGHFVGLLFPFTLKGRCMCEAAGSFIPAHHVSSASHTPISTQIRFNTPVNLWLGLLPLKLEVQVLKSKGNYKEHNLIMCLRFLFSSACFSPGPPPHPTPPPPPLPSWPSPPGSFQMTVVLLDPL